LALDDQQDRLDELMESDPVGAIWFGHDDEWLDKRLGQR
jgi:hypothetical protein